MDSGFWFSVSFRFRIPHFRAARQQAGVPAQTTNAKWTWTTKRTQSKRKPESNPNGTNRGLRVQKTAMLQDGKNKRLIADLQSNISKNCTLLTLLYRRWTYLASRTWYAKQFHNIIVVPTIEYRRSKIKVLHTTQDIKVSIKSSSYTRWIDWFGNLVSLQCWNWFYYVVVPHRNQKSSLWIFKSIDSFCLGILTRKNILEMDSQPTCRRAKSIAFECLLCETSWNVTSMTS